MTHITDHPVTQAAQEYAALLQSALDAAEARERALQARLEAAEGQEARLRKVLRYVLSRQAFQPQKSVWAVPTRLICGECEAVWANGQPEQHAADCRLVEWREMAAEDKDAETGGPA